MDEVFALLDGIETADAAGARDRALLEFLYASGLRVGELVSLNIDDVDLPAGMVRVVGKGKKERVVPFGSKAAEALRGWLEASSPLREQDQGRERTQALQECARLRGGESRRESTFGM